MRSVVTDVIISRGIWGIRRFSEQLMCFFGQLTEVVVFI